MSNKFISILEAIGKDFMEGLTVAVKYLLPVEKLAGLIFPAEVAPLQEAVSVADLLQNAVASVEQKYAAAGIQSGTGAQKADEVLTLASSAVTSLLATPSVQSGLASAGITVDSTYISNLVDGVVGILNLQGVTSSSVAAPAAAAA